MTSDYMREAFALARQGVALATPNPMVGALVVLAGRVVGRGFHTWDGVKHAEILALEEAGGEARGATVYLTLEPCAHSGRTPPCAEALIAAGVAKVVAATSDPNPLVAGEGFRRLRAAGIAIEMATEFQAEGETLNEAFFHFMRTGRPLVTLKSASTLDGKIAAPEDNSGWITSERARAHVQGLRHASDAIVTGIGTALADDPQLTDRSGLPRARPLLRVVLDSTLRLPLESRLVQTAVGDLVVAATSAASAERRRALENRGIEVRIFDGPRGRVDIRDVIALLGERKCLSVMIEAGSKVNWAALESGAVDKVFLYYAPKILGGLQSLPMAGGTGRMRRADAILLERTKLHPIPPDEFAVEAYVRKDAYVRRDV
ncbi:MAG TPA: bifunctional diaminohydroxyphosphoribosylaminopyrimidine deaminase/5-amino-6-(5-phosphoribosylamino)uracil reductase RibD [Bryobacteraceae bacterium]|jgi:diaminohydroxyphosphoribosylaminopyrimidine deaminase/5-amino-6-(5-phosphoribosylamino)uracil reductase|nr:bifunctional diaminohydroxyphosphoribosylaminopyrimidine deaminase/5-amino-6-(5-phosphoribosylamino)uracil reductase RibD [Bryobacteraceae bacterium]